jgi:hypothetical protein
VSGGWLAFVFSVVAAAGEEKKKKMVREMEKASEKKCRKRIDCFFLLKGLKAVFSPLLSLHSFSHFETESKAVCGGVFCICGVFFFFSFGSLSSLEMFHF